MKSNAGSAGRRVARCGLVFTWAALTVAACGKDPVNGSASTTPNAGDAGRNDTSDAASGRDSAGDAASGRNSAGGDSTVTAGTSDTGGTIIGGTGGTGGSASGGHGGTAGSGGHGGTAGSGKLGAACSSDAECQEAATGSLLKCVKSTDTVLGAGAPPRGLCTLACRSDDQCTPFDVNAVCYAFGPLNTASYCVEGCTFGPPNLLGEAKCHNRPELACDPALLAPTNAACEAHADCEPGELCNDGVCNVVTAGCLPACRGDVDCDAGMYCDQAFLSGVCVRKKQTGKPLGEPCTVPAAGAPAEPDECLGFCQADAAGGVNGHCSATCGLGNECAWNAVSGKYDGVCFYASVLTADSGDLGDFGFCTPSCNCDADCNNAALACSQLSQGLLSTDSFRGAGLCFSPDATTIEYNHCADSGAGGATGAAGAGGAP